MKQNNSIIFLSIMAISLFCFKSFANDTLDFPRIIIQDDLSIKTYTGITTEFDINAFSPLGIELVKYELDLDGDGSMDLESSTNHLEHQFTLAGSYQVKILVTDTEGYSDSEFIYIEVYSGNGIQENLSKEPLAVIPAKTLLPGDDIHTGKVLMVNHAEAPIFWTRSLEFYNALKNSYCLSDDDIIFLNYNGSNPDSINPDNIIDGSATKDELVSVFSDLAASLNEDDILLFWSMGHGLGYCDLDYDIGYARGLLVMKAMIDPTEIGDADDIIESDFILRALFTARRTETDLVYHGLNQWAYSGKVESSGYSMKRVKYVAEYDLTLRNGDAVSDHDAYIEKLVSYPKGDINEDGDIDASEEPDSNYNGILPFDPWSYKIDEDDWGEVSFIIDNFNNISNSMPGADPGAYYIIHDNNFDNKLDIDISPGCHLPECIESELEADMTDIYNDGFFRGIDLNKDGDYDDYISVDEKMQFWDDIDLLDDELRSLMLSLSAGQVVIIMNECHSGGFIDDLSSDNRIVSTAVIEDQPASSNSFHFRTMEAISDLSISDENQDNLISFAEIYNYSVDNLISLDNPRSYDDNADAIGHSERLPYGGDGGIISPKI